MQAAESRNGAPKRAARRERAPKTPEPAASLSIGELARLTGVSRRTIRYYEELGILPEPARSPGGTRKYPADYVFYVEGALALKEIGFTLEELKLVGRLALAAPMSPAQRTRAVKVIGEKMKTLEHKIRVLTRIHDILEQEGHASPSGQASPKRLVDLIAP